MHNNNNYTYLQLKFRDYVSDNESMSAQSTFIHNQDDLLSISFFIWVKTFEETTDDRADTVLNIERNKKSDEIEYHSFQNESDYIFALWLHSTHITKRKVNEFFADEWLIKMHSYLSFKNENEWLRLLKKILYEIDEMHKRQKWTSQKFTVESVYENIADQKYVIQYWCVLNIIHFLLDHQSFQNELIYALVHHYNENNWRVYSEMHTEKWWWKTQKKLLNNATLVLLLISTDKTVLTQHWEDLSA